MIRPDIPHNPSIPRRIKKLKFTPPTNSIPTIVITIITPVPKSGCSIISPKINKHTKNIGNTPFFILLSSFLFRVKYFAVKIIKDILANSLGCIPKDPIPNQLRLPFLTLPIHIIT